MDPALPEAPSQRRSLRLREATANDSRRFWELNNAPSVRAASIHAEPMSWSAHRTWYAERLRDARSHLFMAACADRVIGIARVELERDGRDAVVSVALASEARGQGLGSQLIAATIAAAQRLRGVEQVVALIRPDNTPSQRAFARAGFQRASHVEIEGVLLERHILAPGRPS